MDLEHKGYHGEYVEDTEPFVVIRGITDIVTGRVEPDQTPEQAFAALVDDYLETLRELGIEPGK